MPKEPMSREERAAILDAEISKYLKKGWIVQSQTETRAQLILKRERGCIGKLLFGIWDLIFKRKGFMIVLEVDEHGKLSTCKRKQVV